jgi:hypothetical protein
MTMNTRRLGNLIDKLVALELKRAESYHDLTLTRDQQEDRREAPYGLDDQVYEVTREIARERKKLDRALSTLEN